MTDFFRRYKISIYLSFFYLGLVIIAVLMSYVSSELSTNKNEPPLITFCYIITLIILFLCTFYAEKIVSKRKPSLAVIFLLPLASLALLTTVLILTGVAFEFFSRKSFEDLDPLLVGGWLMFFYLIFASIELILSFFSGIVIYIAYRIKWKKNRQIQTNQSQNNQK